MATILSINLLLRLNQKMLKCHRAMHTLTLINFKQFCLIYRDRYLYVSYSNTAHPSLIHAVQVAYINVQPVMSAVPDWQMASEAQ